MSGHDRRRRYTVWLGGASLILLVLSGITLYLLHLEPEAYRNGSAFGVPGRGEHLALAELAIRPHDLPGEVRVGSPGAPIHPALEAARTATGTPAAAVAPDTTDPRLATARAAAARSDWDEALRLYDLIVDKPGVSPELIAERARVLAWSGNFSAAAAGLDDAIALDPTRAEWLLDRARYRWWAGEIAAADAAIGAYLRLRPDDAEALALQEQIRLGLDPIVAAARAWLEERETPSAHLQLARAYAREGRPAEALKHYRVASASGIFPDSLLLEFASIALTADSAIVAATALEQYLWFYQPGDREARIRLARAYAWAGLTDKAIATYSDLLTIQDDPTLRFERAQLYAWAGRERLAEQELHQVIAQQPDHAPSLKLLGDLARWRGDLERALGRYRQALAAAPADEELKVALRETEEAQATFAAKAQPLPTPSSWIVGLDGFDDSEGFRWLSAQATRSWGSSTRSVALMVQQGGFAGSRSAGEIFRTFGSGAQVEARARLAGGWTGRIGVGVQHFTDVGTFPTWTTGLEWLDSRGNTLALGYARQPAVRGALTAASLGAEAVSDAVRLTAQGALGEWLFASELAAERFDSQLGQTTRGAGSIVIGRSITAGLSARGLVRGIFADNTAPLLTDWGALYWAPRYFIMPGFQLAYYTRPGDRWDLGLRAGSGLAYVEERAPWGRRYDGSRATVTEAGLDLGYRVGGWRLPASGDWSGALPRGYKAAALRLRISSAEPPR
jgi:tetratricopeptide (TPR) repeat protein